MIELQCYLKDYNWGLKVYYEATSNDLDAILKDLDEVDCDIEAMHCLANMLDEELFNCGFTYTDNYLHKTFIVIGKTTCAAEFQNTYDHEKGHAAVHIALALDIDFLSEDFLYLLGSIGQETFKVAQHLLCDHCRLNFVNYGKIKVKM